MNLTMINKKIGLLKDWTNPIMFPDTCQLHPISSVTVSERGIYERGTVAPRQYNGSINIPCRVDVARAFRPEKLKEQVVVADEFTLELPHDVTIDASDTVFIAGVPHKIRKLNDASEWDVTVFCSIERLSNDREQP